MPIGDAYATAAEYRARIDKSDNADDADILEALKGVARFIDRQCGRHFTQSAADQVRYFDGNGRAKLYVDDIVTLTAAAVDTGLDGTYAQAVTVASNVLLSPYNAAEISEPFTAVELAPYGTNNELSAWTRGPKTVKLTATWGWPAVPDAIREANVFLARVVLDFEKAGPALQTQSIDQAETLIADHPIMKRIVDKYARVIMEFI